MLVRQSSFHAGEISPNLFSRTDIPSRRFGVRSLRNFIPTSTGAALNRPGFRFVGGTKDNTKRARLIPFTFSSNQSYLLEFGNLYVRVWRNGAPLNVSGAPAYSAATTYALDAYVSSGGINYRSLQNGNLNHTPASSPTFWVAQDQIEVTTPYLESELPTLQYAQFADTLDLVHPAHPRAELKRTGATSWVYQLPSTTRTSTPPSSMAFSTPAPITSADDTHAVKPWEWVSTSVQNDEESTISSSLVSTTQLAPDRPIKLTCTPPGGNQIIYWYRGRFGTYGYIGSSVSGAFLDEGQTPNYSDKPPSQLDPFASGQNPAVVTYFQQRRFYANLPSFPQRIVGSKTGRIRDFDYSLPQKKDDAVDFTVASCMYEEIRGLVGLQQLVIFTANTEYIADAGAEPLAFDNIQLIPIGYNGSSWVRPLLVGDTVLFVPPAQSSVRELTFGGDSTGWSGAEVSVPAQHLLSGNGYTIQEWAYQKTPYSVAWIVRNDGALLSLTYDPAFKVSAWAHHDTGFDVVESVACIPETTEDVVYVIVNRNIGGSVKRYIERLTKRTQITTALDGNFLDCSVEAVGGPVISGLTHLNGRTVYATRDGVLEGPFTVSGGSVTLSASGTHIVVGIAYSSDIELLDLSVDLGDGQGEIGPHEKLVSTVVWEVDNTFGLQAGESTSALVPWRAPLGWSTPPDGTELFVVPIVSSWNRYGRAVLRQTQPFAVGVLGVTRVVELGGI